MGLLVDGQWHDQWYDTEKTGGAFVRTDAQFRHWVSPEPDAPFPAVAGRYHLYVSMACPWAHRTLIFRALKQLDELIDVTVVHPDMLENGWEFKPGWDCDGDPLYGLDYLYQLYLKADPNYSGRVTVPVLWDKQTQTIVSNESSEIIRMFNSAFDHLTGNDRDFYPEALQVEIEAVNERVYHSVNNGVYKAGFATEQAPYEKAYTALFESLDWLEARLGDQRYLVGEQLTEADWRLFTTLIRFDAVYFSHFKCNRQRIEDYPNLSHYLRDLYQQPGIAATVDLEQIKRHYYHSQRTVNPSGVVPLGPTLDYDRPHHRDRLS